MDRDVFDVTGSNMSYGETYFDTDSPCGEHTMTAEVDLSCGATVVVSSGQYEPYCRGYRTFSVYPNPTNDLSTVEPIESEEKGKKRDEREFTVSLFNDKGKVLLKKRSSETKAILNTTDFPDGTYFLHIQKDGEKSIIKQQLVVKHNIKKAAEIRWLF